MTKKSSNRDRAGESFADYDSTTEQTATAEEAAHGTPEPSSALPASGVTPSTSERTGANGQAAKVVKSKRQRFEALAKARYVKAVKALRALARCADARSYEYTQDESIRIRKGIAVEFAEFERLFRGESAKAAAISF